MYVLFSTLRAEATFSLYEGIHLEVPRPTAKHQPHREGKFFVDLIEPGTPYD